MFLKGFAKFTGKYLCWSLLIKLQTWRPAKKFQHRFFHVNITKFLRAHFLRNTSVGCLRCFKKFVNFPAKHQYRRPNTFIFLVYTNDVNLLKLADILHIYITWVIFQQFSSRDLKLVAFLVLFHFHRYYFKIRICLSYTKIRLNSS